MKIKKKNQGSETLRNLTTIISLINTADVINKNLFYLRIYDNIVLYLKKYEKHFLWHNVGIKF